MKIFQIITVSEYGGAQSVVANLCREFYKDHEIFILYGGEGESWEGLDKSIHRLRLGKHRKEISVNDIVLFFRLLYYRFRFSPDIVHLHSSKMGALGRLAFPKKKIVYTVHGFDSIRIAHRKFIFLEKYLAPKTGSIVGVSQYDLINIKKERINGNTQVIRNGIPDYYTKTKNKNNDLIDKRLIQIKQDYERVIICIARLAPPKDFPLFEATAKLLPSYAFVWIGNEQEVANTPSNIFCLGSLAKASSYLRHADAFMLPSGFEGLPMSIIEALSFSLPIVASRVGGIRELINEGKNGYTVENKPEEFATHISSLFKDSKIYENMCHHSRSLFEKYFTVEQMSRGYLDIYKKLKHEK